MTQAIQILAHRGASHAAPENTVPAFELAVKEGADGLEIDVHPTRDGVLVAIHDDTVDRTTDGTGRVVDLTFDEVRGLDAGSRFSPDFAGVQVPALDEVLDFVAVRGLVLNIELKDAYRQDMAYADLAERVAEAVIARDLIDSVVISSFNHSSIARLSALRPELTTGLLLMMALHEFGAYAERTGARAVHPPLPALDDALLLDARAAGMAVNAWTLDPSFLALTEEEQITAMASLGVDAIITNIPARARKIVEARA